MNKTLIALAIAMPFALAQGFWIYTDAKKEEKNIIGFGASLGY